MEQEEGDLLELLELEVSQLGCIDDLMNENQMIDHNIIINDIPLNNIDTSKLLSGDQNLDDHLGFDQAVAETLNNQGFDYKLGFNQQLEIINNDAGPVDAAISIPADANLVSDLTIFAPRNMRKKPRRWTKQEQSQFRKAIENGMWGKWKEVSESYIPSKTPSQITSHAQKYALRKNNTHKKRKSINDDEQDHTYDQPLTALPPTRSDGSHHDHVNTIDHHHHHQHVLHDSSSSSSSLPMVTYDQMCSPVQSSTPRPLMTPPPTLTHMHGNGMMMMSDMPPAAALYYKCMQLEKQINMLFKLRRHMMMTMPVPPPINAQLSHGPAYSASNADPFGLNRPLQPYVGNSHDAYYNYNAPLDHQALQPQRPLVDQQITHHHHQGGHPPNHTYY